LNSGIALVTYDASGGCSGLTATIQKEGSTEKSGLTANNGEITFKKRIPANTAETSINYTIEVTNTDTSSACTTYLLAQDGTVTTCECGDSATTVFSKSIPYDGYSGQLLVYEAWLYKDGEMGSVKPAFSESCHNDLAYSGWSGNHGFGLYYRISADTIPSPLHGRSGSVTDLKLYVKDVPRSKYKVRLYETISLGFADGNKWCVTTTITQDGFVPCTCDDLVNSFWQNPQSRYFTSSGTNL
jgi:hypothetical protein